MEVKIVQLTVIIKFQGNLAYIWNYWRICQYRSM